MSELTLRTALGKSPLVHALKQGAIASDRIAFDFVDVDPVTRAFRRMTRARSGQRGVNALRNDVRTLSECVRNTNPSHRCRY